jgi:hypothetical protein
MGFWVEEHIISSNGKRMAVAWQASAAFLLFFLKCILRLIGGCGIFWF